MPRMSTGRSLASSAGATLAVCASFAASAAILGCAILKDLTGPGDAASPSAKPTAKPSGPRPPWVGRSFFFEEAGEEVALYGVGSHSVDTKQTQGCWNEDRIVTGASSRAMAELVRFLSGTASGATGGGGAPARSEVSLEGARAQLGWFDGDRTAYVVARASRPRAELEGRLDPKDRLEAKGGVPLVALKDAVRAGSRSAVEASGACGDARRRPDLACCGDRKAFCSDPTRHDQALGDGTCRCGDEEPCLYDFVCAPRGDAKKCICKGPKCPCSGLLCRSGQACGDGRCY